MPSLRVTMIPVGPLEANCVILTADAQRDAIVFDPGADPDTIFAELDRLEVTAAMLVQTHCHGDHIGALSEVKARFPAAPVVVHEAEREWLSRPMLNLSMMMGEQITGPEPDRNLVDGDVIELGAIRLSTLHVPGHSPGSVAFYASPDDGGPLLVAGDALFAGGIGRTDFPGGSFEQLADGIRQKLYTLPDETPVYPGHGPATTIGAEKRSNPFVRAS